MLCETVADFNANQHYSDITVKNPKPEIAGL